MLNAACTKRGALLQTARLAAQLTDVRQQRFSHVDQFACVSIAAHAVHRKLFRLVNLNSLPGLVRMALYALAKGVQQPGPTCAVTQRSMFKITREADAQLGSVCHR